MFDAALGRRVAALAILLVVVLAAWLGPISAYVDVIHTNAAAIARRQALLTHYRLLTQVRPPSSPARQQQGLLLPAMPDAQAAALLQERVKAIATGARVRIDALQVLPSGTLGGAEKIDLRVRGAGDDAALARLLYAIEAARPLLLPDNLSVVARAATRVAERSPRLEFDFEIAGFTPGPRP